MAWTYDNQDWARVNNGRIELKNADGTWSPAGTPEHAESMSYVQKAADSAEVDKLIAYARSGGTLNAEQQAFLANPLLGMDSYGQGSRWGALNLFDNQFSPQQAGALMQFGVPAQLSQSDIDAGNQFNYEQSPAQQSARDDDGGLFGGDLGKLAMLAAVIYSGGAAGGLWGGLGEGAALAGAGEAASLGSLGSGTMGVNLAGLGSYGTTAGMAGALGSGLSGTTLASLGLDAAALGGLGAGVAGAASGSGGSMFDWTDVADFFGEGTAGATADWGASAAGYGQNMATAAELAQMQSQYPDWYNALTGVTDVGISPSNIWNAYKAATGGSGSGLLSGGLNALGGYLTGNAAVDAANATAQSQMTIANKAFEQSRFQPVGITNNPFGTAQYQYDANGRLIGAQATPSAQLKAQQDALMANSGQMLSQYTNAPSQFAPMGQAGQTAMALGNSYLSTTPQQQAQKYMQDQQALLATGRERDMNQMLTGEFNRGTYGLSTGGTSTGMMGSNPRLEALMNAQRQQDLGLAAQATQGGMDYAKFGTGMVGLGGDLTKGMYTGQTAAYDPYKTALGGAQQVQGLGESALTQGMEFGRLANNTGAAGNLQQGMLSAAQTQQKADSFSPWGSLLSGAGNIAQQYATPQQTQYKFNPFTGAPM